MVEKVKKRRKEIATKVMTEIKETPE